MKIYSISIFIILIMSFSSVQAKYKDEPYETKVKDKVNIGKNITLGKVTPPPRDPRIHTPVEIMKHKKSNIGASTVGVTVPF